MKKDWNTKSLADVCQIRPPKEEARRKILGSEKVSFVPMEDLGIDHKYFIPTKSRSLSDVIGGYTYFADGDVLLAKITPCFENGKLGIATNLVNGVGFGSSEYVVFRPNAYIDKEWLYYFLSNPVFRKQGAQRMSGAVGHKRVPLEFIEHYPIPVPPLPEQQRIVAILDQAFDAITRAKANAERNRANARALFESHLQEVFRQRGEGWVETTIGEHIHFIDYRGHTPEKTDSGMRLITAKNVKMGYLQETPMEYVSPEIYNRWMTRGIPKYGDVLFTTEAPLANIAQLDTHDKVVFAQRIIIMQPDSTLDSTFLKYLLLSKPVQDRIHEKGTGATVKGIKAKLLRTVSISYPLEIALQKDLVSKFDALSAETLRLATIYSQKIAELDELKASLLHQAFSGEL